MAQPEHNVEMWMQQSPFTEVILENIFRYLSYDDLLKTKLVSQKWRKESDRAIKKRDNFLFLSTEEDFLKTYAKITELKCAGSYIIFNKFSLVFENISLSTDGVQKFFKAHGDSATQLKVRFGRENENALENTPELFKTLLQSQLLNLESLQIFGLPPHLYQEKSLFDENEFDGVSKFLLPKLKVMGFISVAGYPHETDCPLYINLLKCIPPVRKLTVNCANYMNIIFENALASKENRMRRSLSEIKDFSTIYGNSKSHLTQRLPENCLPITNGNFLYNLARFCKKLVKLRLCLGNQVPKVSFEYLMRNVAENLEELELSDHCQLYPSSSNADMIPLANKNDTRLSDVTFTKLKVMKLKNNIFIPPIIFGQLLPKNFPALSHLKVQYSHNIFDKTSWNDTQRHGLKCLILDGLPLRDFSQAINFKLFAETFPALKCLKLNAPNNDILRGVYANFPQLEELEINGGYTDEGICGIPQDTCNSIHRSVEMETSPSAEYTQYRGSTAYIGNLRNLRKLKIASNFSTVAALYGLADLTNLTSLYIEFCWLNDLPIRKIYLHSTLKYLPNLLKLEISEVFVPYTELSQIKKIANCRFIPDRTIHLL